MKCLFIGIGLAVVFLVAVLAIGCNNSDSSSSPRVESVDCKTDLDCFIEFSKKCDPATLSYSATINVFGVLATASDFFEIKGLEMDKCVFYIRIDKMDLKFSDELVQRLLASGATKEEIEQLEEEANRQADIAEGLDGICRFETNDLVAVLSRWKTGKFSSDDWKVAECEGELFNQQYK